MERAQEQAKDAAAAKDFHGIDDAAHKLKGILSYLAAKPAVNAAADLEKAGKNRQDDNLAHQVAFLEAHCLKVLEFISKFDK